MRLKPKRTKNENEIKINSILDVKKISETKFGI